MFFFLFFIIVWDFKKKPVFSDSCLSIQIICVIERFIILCIRKKKIENNINKHNLIN